MPFTNRFLMTGSFRIDLVTSSLGGGFRGLFVWESLSDYKKSEVGRGRFSRLVS